jgi:hypothetical protein
MTSSRFVGFPFILMAALFVTACVAVSRERVPSIASDEVAPVGFPHSIRVVRDIPQTFEEREAQITPRVAAATSEAPINILALSGGGAGGAFGAGVLVGWSRAGTRPDFQIVTGVSSGALIAPLAFLGSSWDGVLEDAFSGSETEHLLQRRPLGALLGSSLYRGKPLAALVEHYATDALIRAVAAEAEKGRLLLVATTNLDTEQTTIWNLTSIAAQGGEQGRKLFRDILIASASIPGIFPPVLIRVEGSGRQFEELHVDGETTTSFFVGPEITGFLPGATTSLHGSNLYVILNAQLGDAAETTPIGTLAIVKRGIAASMSSGTRTDLQIAYFLARQNDLNLRVTDIPPAYPFRGPLDLSPSAMKPLFDYGVRCASKGQAWKTPLAVEEAAESIPSTQVDTVRCPAASVRHAPSLQATDALEQAGVATPAGH